MTLTIAFIGLGNLGLPMAVNIARAAGHRVVGYDIAAAPMAEAARNGVEPAASAVDAVREAGVVITMVPSGKELRSLFFEDGIVDAAGSDTLFIDCSTVDLESAAACKALARSGGHEMVDAPVSGGAPRAIAGHLTIMVGGTPPAFARAEPILSLMASNVVHMGPDGTGITIKLCNNMIAGVTLAAVGEAYALAQRLRVNEQKFFDVVSKSSGQCWALTEMCPVPGPVPTSPANNDFKPGGAARMLVKDLGMAQQAAFRVGSSVPMAASAYGLYSLFCNAGQGDLDVSAIIKMFQEETVA
jgi:3-hydroxyisobutyrate dehydrogenase